MGLIYFYIINAEKVRKMGIYFSPKWNDRFFSWLKPFLYIPDCFCLFVSKASLTQLGSFTDSNHAYSAMGLSAGHCTVSSDNLSVSVMDAYVNECELWFQCLTWRTVSFRTLQKKLAKNVQKVLQNWIKV